MDINSLTPDFIRDEEPLPAVVNPDHFQFQEEAYSSHRGSQIDQGHGDGGAD